MPLTLEDYARRVRAWEESVLDQRAVPAEHYDDEYFTADWREGDNRYDLGTRRRIEDRNPRLIKEVFAPSKVLDVGCGPGFLMYFLHELGVECDGVDFSPRIRELAPPEVREKIIIAPVTRPQVPEASYDLVICREVMEHLSVVQVQKTVQAICDASSRYVYVTTRFHPEPEDLLDFTTQFEVDPSHITLLNKELLRSLFVLQGFRSRPDLEERMDWAGKDRVIVAERTEAADA